MAGNRAGKLGETTNIASGRFISHLPRGGIQASSRRSSLPGARGLPQSHALSKEGSAEPGSRRQLLDRGAAGCPNAARDSADGSHDLHSPAALGEQPRKQSGRSGRFRSVRARSRWSTAVGATYPTMQNWPKDGDPLLSPPDCQHSEVALTQSTPREWLRKSRQAGTPPRRAGVSPCPLSPTGRRYGRASGTALRTALRDRHRCRVEPRPVRRVRATPVAEHKAALLRAAA